MKSLQNNYTTPEQSKRLLELGVPADSADMYIPEGCTPYVFVQGNTYSKAMKNWGLNICDNRVTPCWSVGRLMEIFDICFPESDTACWPPYYELDTDYITYVVHLYERGIMELDFSKLED